MNFNFNFEVCLPVICVHKYITPAYSIYAPLCFLLLVFFFFAFSDILIAAFTIPSCLGSFCSENLFSGTELLTFPSFQTPLTTLCVSVHCLCACCGMSLSVLLTLYCTSAFAISSI